MVYLYIDYLFFVTSSQFLTLLFTSVTIRHCQKVVNLTTTEIFYIGQWLGFSILTNLTFNEILELEFFCTILCPWLQSLLQIKYHMVDRRKALSLISSRDHCQRFSPSRISDMPWAGFEPGENLSSGLVEWSSDNHLDQNQMGKIHYRWH